MTYSSEVSCHRTRGLGALLTLETALEHGVVAQEGGLRVPPLACWGSAPNATKMYRAYPLNGNDCYSLRTGKWPIDIVDLPKDGDFPVRYLSLPEGSIVPLLCHVDTFF